MDRWTPLLVASLVCAATGCRSSPHAYRGERHDPGTSSRATAHRQGTPSADPDADKASDRALSLMLPFAERTRIQVVPSSERYLWTDAFAVCNFIALARMTADERYMQLARRLVDNVHHTLGKHRADDTRSGWISGLRGDEAEAHPTRGGLRIGKKLPERAANEAFDDELEWDRDGQYFHYLTKWMHALDRLAEATGNPKYNDWARELAATSYRAFSYGSRARERRMYWKMSIDLTRPLVRSMGQHDALDGYVTAAELRATAAKLSKNAQANSLEEELAGFAAMLNRENLATTDPLGLGGLLTDAYRIHQLNKRGAFPAPALRDELLEAALSGLEYYLRSDELKRPAERRLAFRELGLAIGLHAMRRLDNQAQSEVLDKLARHASHAQRIIDFWLEPRHQAAATWTEHRNINEVMLATALVPDGFLGH